MTNADFGVILFRLMLAFLIPVLFWMFDAIAKLLGSISIEDIGADLCLFGVSFNVTTLLISTTSTLLRSKDNTPDASDSIVVIALLALVVSLILYVFSLLLIAPTPQLSYPQWISRLIQRPQSWRVTLTIRIGIISSITQLAVYAFVL